MNISQMNRKEFSREKRSGSEGVAPGVTDAESSASKDADKSNEIINGSGGMLAMNDFYQTKIVEILFDRHHLLSTKKIKGILDNK